MFILEKEIQEANKKEILSLLGYEGSSKEATRRELTLDLVLIALKKRQDRGGRCSYLNPEFIFSDNQHLLRLSSLRDWDNDIYWDLTKRTLEEQEYRLQEQIYYYMKATKEQE
jgi:hypothetical protein